MSYKEYDLPYMIVCKNEVIARFKNIPDRDDCLSFLQDRYEDYKFKAVNEEDLV